METVELNNGVKMPLLGFGVFQIDDEQVCEQSVMSALLTGYRMIDTAACYGNERAVGSAVKKAVLKEIKYSLCQRFGFKMQDMKKQKYLLKKHCVIYRLITLTYT